MTELKFDYWNDDGWFVGRLKDRPAVCSQGQTLEELEANLRDALALMYPLHGEPVSYIDPFEPAVPPEDWDALQ